MMKRSPEEIAALRESFRKMDTIHKIEYIYTYYKWMILLILVAVYAVGSMVHHQLTQKKPVLYVGFVNVSVGEDLQRVMTEDYVDLLGLNKKKNEVSAYTGLYLSEDPASDDHQYAYASRMKVMAVVNGKMLDVVLMNGEAYRILSESGYLLPLEDLPGSLQPYLTQNNVILETNAIDVTLNKAEEYEIVSEAVTNGLNASEFPIFRNAGFDGAIYLGVLGNTVRYDTVVSYLEYLLAADY